MLKRWDCIPDSIKNDQVKLYYDSLYSKRFSLLVKRVFDLIFAIMILIILLPLCVLIGIAIKLETREPIIYRQIRATQYGKPFKIYKFRRMAVCSDIAENQVTVRNDSRITKVGRILRKYRIDEVPQLINIILGEMSFVGSRPEVLKYVNEYTDEMLATLLLPAGITSEASVQFKDEDVLLEHVKDIDSFYINTILPEKMHLNLKYLKNYSLVKDMIAIFKTVIGVLK